MKIKALALLSGGLDSILAARAVQEQGVETIGLFAVTNFGVGKSMRSADLVERAAQSAGVRLERIDISDDFLAMLKRPRFGFGSQMNPCIDCKILMLQKAKQLLDRFGASFVITGEVLGQRPMSQHRKALELIEKQSGLEGLLLRPLSAKLLPETVPEKSGWVERSKLYDFSGRSRKAQILLAEQFGIKEYPNAAGGCLLTERDFVRRLKDLGTHNEVNKDNISLLKVGRHFRFGQAKLIVSRNEHECNELMRLAKPEDYLFLPDDEMAGPTALGRGNFDDALIRRACEITLGYCDLDKCNSRTIILKRCGADETRRIDCHPMERAAIAELRI